MVQKRNIPTVRLRRLAAELRRLRADGGFTREEVTERTAITGTTLYRVEHAQTRPQRRTLIGLLDLYEVQGAQRDELLALAQRASELGWLRPYHEELPDEYTSYISFESEAWEIRNSESLFVPGLLQTEDYAREAIRGTLPMTTAEEVESRVRARIERQAVLSKEEPLRLRAVMDEAALHRVVGGPDTEIMRAQMLHLTTVMQLP
ncbi:XRE family transcriptional regulator, partial [Streptomyces klenkii]